MSRYDSYAGQIEIYAISNLLNKNIRVYIHNKGKFSNVGLGYELKNKDIKDDIFLYHNLGKTKSKGSHHFEPLYPKNMMKVKRRKTTTKKSTTKTTTKKRTIKKRTTKRTTKKRTTTKRNTKRTIKRTTKKRNTKKRTTKRTIKK